MASGIKFRLPCVWPLITLPKYGDNVVSNIFFLLGGSHWFDPTSVVGVGGTFASPPSSASHNLASLLRATPPRRSACLADSFRTDAACFGRIPQLPASRRTSSLHPEVNTKLTFLSPVKSICSSRLKILLKLHFFLLTCHWLKLTSYVRMFFLNCFILTF